MDVTITIPVNLCHQPRFSLEQFSHVELAVALLNPALRYDPQTLRLGAAMLSAEGNRPEQIARLAVMERSEAVVRYIAEAGHPTRFVAMTGFTRRGPELIIQWIRPSREKAVHG